MTLCTFKRRKRICTYLSHIFKDFIIILDYVRLSRYLYIHYVRLSTSFKKCSLCPSSQFKIQKASVNKDSNVQGDMRASITLVYFAYLGIRIYLSVCCSVFSALPSSCKSCFQLNFPIKAFTRVDNNDEQGVIKARGHGLVSQFAGTCQPCWQLGPALKPFGGSPALSYYQM